MIVLLSMSYRHNTVILYGTIYNCFVDLAIGQDRLLALLANVGLDKDRD